MTDTAVEEKPAAARARKAAAPKVTEPTYKAPAIHEAIFNIQRDIGSIPKNGEGPKAKGGFKFIKNDDILDRMHKLLVDNNVIIAPVLEIEHKVDNSGGRMLVNAIVKLQNTYTSTLDGSTYVAVGVGEGSDIGSDTATRKAVTQAQKIINLLMFSIATGEEETEGEDIGSTATVATAPAPNDKLGNAGNSIAKLKAQAQAAGRAKGLGGADLNAMGREISEDYLTNVGALEELIARIGKK